MYVDPLPATVTTDDASDLTSATNKSKKFKLQRSESDRVPLKPTNEEYSFKDTMRIKTMRKHYNKDLIDRLLLRPKEPPPPPPNNQTEKKQMDNATPATKSLGHSTSDGALAMNEKLPRVNPRGSLLEDTNSENLVVSKAIHLKLIKNNPDYESIKLFNKYELPSIPEEQKLSPVLNKKETGSKFVVNDVQSALLKEINDKLRRMEEKRAKKENLYDDIIEDLGDDSTRDETMGSEQLENVLENTSDTKEGEQTETLSDDHSYDSPAEPYEIIELKPKLTLTMDNKEIKYKDKTENRNIKHTEQSAHLNSVNSCKAQPDRELMQGNEHDVKKEKELINNPKTYLGIQNENVHLPNPNNSTKSTKSLSPINASFHPKDTSTPIHTRVKSNIEELSSNISDKSSHQSSLLNQSCSKSVSTISVESNVRNTVADSKTHSSISTATTLGEKKSTVAATSNEMMNILPKKSSGTSILINNTTNQNKSSIMITNNSGVSEPAQSFPTMPKFHIGPNGTIGRNSTKTPSTTKINCNVITINITPDVKDVNTNSSFTNFGQPVSEVILGTGATPNRTFVSHVNSNATNLGKPEDIYHSSNILIKHDLSQTYADFTPDDTMLDSLIEIPEHYQQSGVKEKIDTNDSSRTNHCDRRTENTNLVVNSKATEKENGKLVITSQLGNRNSALTIEDKTNDKTPNQARIDEINQTFSNLIKDNYDPIRAVKNKLVPHICKKENAEDEPVNKGSVESAHKENNASMENGMDLVKVTAGDMVTPMKIETAEDLRKVEPVATEITTNKDALDKLNADKANDSGAADFNDATSTSDYGSHYYMSSRIDTIIEDIEKEQEEEEDHYETIGEPIYDEIPPPLPKSSPPPLPLCPPPASLSPMSTNLKSIFEGASKSDILNYLVDAKQRFIDPSVAASHHHRLATLDSGLDSSNRSDSEYNSDVEFDFRSGLSHLGHHSDSSDCSIVIHEDSISLSSSDSTIRKEYVDIERNDSGVGSETSTSCRAKWQTLPSISSNHTQHECEDCDEPVHTQVTESGIKFAPLICEKCTKMRAERREIILEIIETEEKYGRDLQIIIDEFYKPMLVAGLLTQDQLESIFLNTEELLDNTLLMSEKLREAFNEGDDEMMTAHVGRIFIEAVPMLTAFQSYCTRQGTAALILANLEKEKELLRIFLRVSQMENSVLRRMNLNSFLMVPVQRVTKYPLLLARLYKVTPDHHTGKDLLIEAQHNIQLHLEHINSLARDLSTTKLWRKISMMNNRRVGYELEDTTYIKLRKVREKE
ncbi:hypothetical protein M8J77_009363 [Diaphorina citri]|nr:hypothetical protein M8J77_009363 [Diaphorina citri]